MSFPNTSMPNTSAMPYLGVAAINPPNTYSVNRDPTSSDKKPVRSIWSNSSTNKVFYLPSYTAGVPNWVELGGGTDTFPITPYVVGPAGQGGYQTVQAAVTAIGSGSGLIWVQPDTYTESLTFTAGCNITIASGSPDLATITGVHTPPSSGFVRFLEITLTSATHIFSSAAAGTAQLTVESCVATCTNGFTFNVANWTGPLQSFHSVHNGTSNGFVTNSGGSAITVSDCTAGSGTGKTMVTTGVTTLEQVSIACPWSPTTGTVITALNCAFARTVTLGGDTTGSFVSCSWSTGATAAITMSSSGTVALLESVITSSNNPAIAGAGAGALTISNVSFTSNTAIAATLTLGTADLVSASSYRTTPLATNVTLSGNSLTATGSDTDISINAVPKGTGAFAVTGPITASTSMTATAGDITATLGNVVINGAAKQLQVHGGAVTDFIGQATLTNGTVTVANTNIAATDRVFVTRSAKNGSTAYGVPLITITAATNFVLTACKSDTTTETGDASTFDYFIVRQV